MSTAAEPALENAESSIAATIPESAKTALPTVKADYGAGEFWKDEAPVKKEEPAKVEPEVKAEVVAEPAKPLTLAEKLAAKNKPVEPVKAAEPAKAAPNPEDGLQLDPKSSPKARENFDNLRTITQTVRRELAAKEKELADLRGKAPVAAPVDNTELERLRAEHKSMSDKLLLIDTKNHPVFQNQYVAPRKAALDAAQELLKANGKEADLAALIEKPRGEIGKALQTILADLPSLDQAEISQSVSTAYKLRQAEEAALAQASSVNGAIRKNEASTHASAFDATWKKVSGDVSSLLEPVEMLPTFNAQQRQSIEEYNSAIASLQENARKAATGAASYESIAEHSIKSAAYDLQVKHVLPRIGAEISAMQEVIKGLKAEVDGYRSRNPNKTISATPSGGKQSAAEPKTIDQLAADAWGG